MISTGVDGENPVVQNGVSHDIRTLGLSCCASSDNAIMTVTSILLREFLYSDESSLYSAVGVALFGVNFFFSGRFELDSQSEELLV